MNDHLIEVITKQVKKVMDELPLIKIEASGRHVHLNQEAVQKLFGENYQLTNVKELSQPGQYLCKERLTLIGPRGKIENVAILGPIRKSNQVEISFTDSVVLGVKPPIRDSGNIQGSPKITLLNEANGNKLQLHQGLIVARRHIHMTPDDAKRFGVFDKEVVHVKVYSKRPLVFEDVLIRVHPNYSTYMHIDFDEANACGFVEGTMGEILKKVRDENGNEPIGR